MKKIIYGFGIVLLLIVAILNFLYTARIDVTENVTVSYNNILYVAGLIGVGLLLFLITRILNKWLYKNSSEEKIELRKFLFWSGFAIYIIINIVWLLNVNPKVGADSIHVATLAQAMHNDNVEEILPSNTYAGISLGEYIQTYQQQIPLAFLYRLFFDFIHVNLIQLLRILNVIGNILIVFALYKINEQISKKYETNKVLLFTMIFTCVPLLLLTTFVYGDTLSIAFRTIISIFYDEIY